MLHKDIMIKWQWKNYVEPWMNTAECVAFSKKYCEERGYPIKSFSWSAFAWWKTWSPFNNSWIRVEYKKWLYPKQWDILFWSESRCKNWHTAVAHNFCNANLLRYTDQNGTWHYDKISPRFSDYKNVLGWYSKLSS